jgi:hypothetical protein
MSGHSTCEPLSGFEAGISGYTDGAMPGDGDRTVWIDGRRRNVELDVEQLRTALLAAELRLRRVKDAVESSARSVQQGLRSLRSNIE